MALELKPFPLESWLETKTALHLFLQIVGKVRMTLHPKLNHWWHVTSYVNANGLTTGPIPYAKGLFEVEFDFIQHELKILTTQGDYKAFALKNLYVADFYEKFMGDLRSLGIQVNIIAKPFDPERTQSDIPFIKDKQHAYQDFQAAQYFWRILTFIYPVFQQFGSDFHGKTTPVHLFWHSMDYVVTRFSGCKGPATQDMDPVSAEAYSDEVISFGFWPGDKTLPEPAFYSYTYPAPHGLANSKITPNTAAWVEVNESPMALLKYSDWIQSSDPTQVLLDFLRSTYDAGSKLADWG